MKKLGYPFEEKYTFHFYGPYSEELSLRMEELTNLGFVSEVKESKSNYYQYRYQVTEEGENFLEHSPVDLSNLEAIVNDMNEKSSRFLELVATMLYFDDLDKADTERKVQEVKKKSNYTKEDMKEAWEFIEKIKH